MKRIMIVDDDPSIQHAMQMIFPADLYLVDVQSNGQLIVDGRFEPPDIFLLDKQLAGVDGLELCRILKAGTATKAIPVVILSASPHIRATAVAAGADAVLEKPFSLAELRQILAAHLK
jgi:DNA-binding response OmpR family regulator